MKYCWPLGAILWLAGASPIQADVYSYYVDSIEWLADSSEFIVQARVVGQWDDKRKSWETRVEKVDLVLKSVDGPTAPPFSNLSAISAEGTHSVLLFGCRTEDKKSVQLTYCIFLNKWSVPADRVERTRDFQDIHKHTSAWQEEPFSNTRCLAIDKEGNVLVEPTKVIEAVDKRVKVNPRRVKGAGRYLKRGQLLEDDESDYNVLVPFDPEFKK